MAVGCTKAPTHARGTCSWPGHDEPEAAAAVVAAAAAAAKVAAVCARAWSRYPSPSQLSMFVGQLAAAWNQNATHSPVLPLQQQQPYCMCVFGGGGGDQAQQIRRAEELVLMHTHRDIPMETVF